MVLFVLCVWMDWCSFGGAMTTTHHPMVFGCLVFVVPCRFLCVYNESQKKNGSQASHLDRSQNRDLLTDFLSDQTCQNGAFLLMHQNQVVEACEIKKKMKIFVFFYCLVVIVVHLIKRKICCIFVRDVYCIFMGFIIVIESCALPKLSLSSLWAHENCKRLAENAKHVVN